MNIKDLRSAWLGETKPALIRITAGEVATDKVTNSLRHYLMDVLSGKDRIFYEGFLWPIADRTWAPANGIVSGADGKLQLIVDRKVDRETFGVAISFDPKNIGVLIIAGASSSSLIDY